MSDKSMSEELEKRLLDETPVGPEARHTQRFEAAAELKAQRKTLEEINAIRNSIVGTQTINWSEHIYPLVAALNEAGLEGMEYPEARKHFGTLIERTNAAEADRDHWEQQAEKNHKATLEAKRENDWLQAMLTAGSQQILTLQLCLTECEKACWREGQTLEGLVRAVRRSAAEHLEGKNPAKQLINENDRLREVSNHLLWAIGVSGMSPSVQKAVSKFKAALGEQDES